MLTLLLSPLVVTALVGFVQLWRQRRQVRWLVAFAALGSVESLCVAGAVSVWQESKDLRFVLRLEPEAVVGRWRLNDETVVFRSDRTFVDADGRQATWDVTGARISATGPWLALRLKEELVLLRNPPEEPDHWNLHEVWRRDTGSRPGP